MPAGCTIHSILGGWKLVIEPWQDGLEPDPGECCFIFTSLISGSLQVAPPVGKMLNYQKM